MDQMVSDSNCCVGRQPGIFDHRLGEICFSLGHANRRTNRIPAKQSTFRSDAGTIPGCNCHSFAYTEGHTHSYPQRYAFPKPSPYASASPASTPSPIASLSFAFLGGSALVPVTEKQRQPGGRDRRVRVQGGFPRLISLLTRAGRLSLQLVL